MSEMMIYPLFAKVSMMRIRGVKFRKSKMCKTNCNFEQFENTINLIYTMHAMSEMMI